MSQTLQKEVDVLIIGAGFAGLSCALWCHSQGLKALVLEQNAIIGGQLNRVFPRIKDYAGFMGVGVELRNFIYRQVTMAGMEVDKKIKIQKIDWEKKEIHAAEGLWRGRALVIATGLKLKTLDVPGEREFWDQGIRSSSTQDFAFYQNHPTVIVGSGDGAVENALNLAPRCPKITLVVRGKELKARGDFVAKLSQYPHVEVLTQEEVQAFEGDEKLERVRLKSGKLIEASRALIKIGFSPDSAFLPKEILDAQGFVRVSETQETGLPGVWAVGDVCTPLFPSLSVCVGQSSIAAKAMAAKLHL